MSTLTKVFVVLTAVLTIAVSCMFIAAAAQWENWKDLATKYQAARDAEITHRMNLQATMTAALAMKDDALASADTKLRDAQKQVQDLTDDNAKLKSDLARAQQEALAFDAARTKLQEILAVTTNERTALQKHNQDLLAQNMDLQTRNTRLNSRNLELTANVNVLTEEVRNLQEKNAAYEQQLAGAPRGMGRATPIEEEPTVGLARAVQPSVAGPIRGRISAINGNYASIDIGETSGVTKGMTFILSRESTGYVGDLVIDTVHPKEAGGKIVSIAEGKSPRPGDYAEVER